MRCTAGLFSVRGSPLASADAMDLLHRLFIVWRGTSDARDVTICRRQRMSPCKRSDARGHRSLLQSLFLPSTNATPKPLLPTFWFYSKVIYPHNVDNCIVKIQYHSQYYMTYAVSCGIIVYHFCGD